MLNNILPFSTRRKPKEIAAYSNDWSYRDDIEDAPTLSQITEAYESQFGLKVTPSSKVLNDAPQLKIAVPITDIVGVDVAVRGFFRGEDLITDNEIWDILYRRLTPIFKAHKASDPAFSFTPTGAAVLAMAEMMASGSFAELSLEGYIKVPQKKLGDLRGELNLTLGSPPEEKPFEGGYLFRFKTSEVATALPQTPTARAVLVDIRGAFSTSIRVGETIDNYRGENPLIILSQRHNKLPSMLRSSPSK